MKIPDRKGRRFAILVPALIAAMALSSGLVGLHAEETQPASEATGHDFYKRGYYDEAIAEWLKAVAETGDPGAAFRLGEEYFDAKIVKRDVAKAVKYLELGAAGGDRRAQMDLGTLYDNGWGVKKDRQISAKWYLAAALNGLSEAQYNIGTMYESGEGVEQDLAKAYMFYLVAIENGFTTFSSDGLERVSKLMSPAEIKRATLMARQFPSNLSETAAP